MFHWSPVFPICAIWVLGPEWLTSLGDIPQDSISNWSQNCQWHQIPSPLIHGPACNLFVRNYKIQIISSQSDSFIHTYALNMVNRFSWVTDNIEILIKQGYPFHMKTYYLLWYHLKQTEHYFVMDLLYVIWIFPACRGPDSGAIFNCKSVLCQQRHYPSICPLP